MVFPLDHLDFPHDLISQRERKHRAIQKSQPTHTHTHTHALCGARHLRVTLKMEAVCSSETLVFTIRRNNPEDQHQH
jgi:hypothetical protein